MDALGASVAGCVGREGGLIVGGGVVGFCPPKKKNILVVMLYQKPNLEGVNYKLWIYS